jgi:hypothetical protein
LRTIATFWRSLKDYNEAAPVPLDLEWLRNVSRLKAVYASLSAEERTVYPNFKDLDRHPATSSLTEVRRLLKLLPPDPG